MEAVVNESLGDVLLGYTVFLEFRAVEDELVSNSASLSSVAHLVVTIELVGHVVRVQDSLDGGLSETRLSGHFDIGVRDWDDACISVWSACNGSSLPSGNWNFTVTWDEWLQMLLESNGSDTWSTTTVRNGEGLMQVQVTNIGTNGSWRGQTQLGIHVGTIHIDLSTVV